jgi:hypothetical protein
VIETRRSTNGKRVATIVRKDGVYAIELTEARRYASSSRARKAPTKTEAVAIARKWVGR